MAVLKSCHQFTQLDMAFTRNQIRSFQKQDYPADLYQFDKAARGVDGGFGKITTDHIQHFQDHGYLIVNEAFDTNEIQRGKKGIQNLVSQKYPDFRGLQIEPRLVKQQRKLTVDERTHSTRKAFNFLQTEPLLKDLFYTPKLLKVVSKLLNDTPVHLQDMALLKPANFGTEKPWHQDCAYFNFPLDVTIVGVWIALDEAKPENGCMHIVPGSHKKPKIHFKKRDWQICDTDVDRKNDFFVPLRPGGVLFFHGLIHHGTPSNRSDQSRWALQFHYRPQNAREISNDDRLSIFGSQGKDVDC